MEDLATLPIDDTIEPLPDARSGDLEPAASADESDPTPDTALLWPAYQRIGAEVLRLALFDATRAKDAKVRAEGRAWLLEPRYTASRAFWAHVAGLDPRTFDRFVGERLGVAAVKRNA